VPLAASSLAPFRTPTRLRCERIPGPKSGVDVGTRGYRAARRRGTLVSTARRRKRRRSSRFRRWASRGCCAR
jgi:hypothetical protein